MAHVTVCVEDGNGNRTAFVISAKTETEAVRFAETFKNRVGYRGNNSFEQAVKRCGMMERDERNAWGVFDILTGKTA